MSEPKTKREMPAREWLVLIGLGIVVAVVAPAMGQPDAVPLGLLLVVVAVFGLAWRLLKDR